MQDKILPSVIWYSCSVTRPDFDQSNISFPQRMMLCRRIELVDPANHLRAPSAERKRGDQLSDTAAWSIGARSFESGVSVPTKYYIFPSGILRA